jgi:hypothetical protein
MTTVLAGAHRGRPVPDPRWALAVRTVERPTGLGPDRGVRVAAVTAVAASRAVEPRTGCPGGWPWASDRYRAENQAAFRAGPAAGGSFRQAARTRGAAVENCRSPVDWRWVGVSARPVGEHRLRRNPARRGQPEAWRAPEVLAVRRAPVRRRRARKRILPGPSNPTLSAMHHRGRSLHFSSRFRAMAVPQYHLRHLATLGCDGRRAAARLQLTRHRRAAVPGASVATTGRHQRWGCSARPSHARCWHRAVYVLWLTASCRVDHLS